MSREGGPEQPGWGCLGSLREQEVRMVTQSPSKRSHQNSSWASSLPGPDDVGSHHEPPSISNSGVLKFILIFFLLFKQNQVYCIYCAE